MKRTLLLFTLAGNAVFAHSALIQYGSGAAMGANDFIDWSQFGVNGTTVASGSTGVTNGGIGFTLSSVNYAGADDGGVFRILEEGIGWTGHYAAGEILLYHVNNGNASLAKVVFDTFVYGAGGQIQTNRHGVYGAQMGFHVSHPGVFHGAVGGFGNSQFNDSPVVYAGGATTGEQVGTIFWRTGMVSGADDLGFAIGKLDVRTNPVPEPASLAALGVGAAALLRRRRK